MSEITTFWFPTKIVFGPGALRLLPQELAARGVRRPLIVTDRGLRRLPLFDEFQAVIGREYPVFSDVDPNPTEQNVMEGLTRYHAESCDGLVGVGGGSALDAAKAMRLKVTHDLPLAAYDDLKDGSLRITGNLPPYIAVPTTAGTGSDVARSAVITVKATDRKTVIFSPHLIPSVSVSDPALTVAMPATITAGTGMDAFTHCFEAYLAKGYHPMCDAIALEGVRLAWDNLARAVSHPGDLTARRHMMMAAIMGATAFQKGLGAVHSLAHPLSTMAGMHHGTSNAVLLPPVIEFNAPVVGDRLKTLGRVLGCDDVAVAIRDLNAQILIAPRLRDYGVAENLLEAMAAKAIEDGCHLCNPRPCTRQDMLQLYRQVF
jgi:alcohol dehydrogenase class IV